VAKITQHIAPHHGGKNGWNRCGTKKLRHCHPVYKAKAMRYGYVAICRQQIFCLVSANSTISGVFRISERKRPPPPSEI